MEKLQLTLAIIKPHAVKNPVAVSYIRNVIKNRFVVVRTRRVILDANEAGDFYQEHEGKFFFNRLVTFMASGCIDLHVIAHKNAIDLWRRMLGPTKVYKAQFQEPYSLRGMFGISDTRNVAHGSDSTVSAEREIKFFFPDFSFYEWHNNDELRYRKGPIIFNKYLFQHVRKL
ncbi:PREDICTED: nucleoside diphosphate kinase 6-like [Papilio xuthus]|uniref:Nucleoside diphosphate kinase 6 n=1 Tax=Papilio xuthus TaxID=66420 RepID=A0A194QBV6_PAPXU|nr:PREDICTED: nucleoside diphosphate kinase 6-like [Papilio xuthus]KPJ02475.1 Nucleoside diphosphate kinase 6 [Papilio xuthus]